MHRSWLSTSAVAVIAGLMVTAQAGVAAPAGQHVFGTIQSVSTDGVTVTGRDGASTVVKETAATKILTIRKGALADVRQGEGVRVIARKAGDGTLTAVVIETGRFDLLPQRFGQRIPTQGAPAPGPGAPATGRTPGPAAPPAVITGRVAAFVGTGATRTLSVNYVSGTAILSVPETVRFMRIEELQLAGLKAGMRIVVSGTTNPDGSITASTIMVAPGGRPGHQQSP